MLVVSCFNTLQCRVDVFVLRVLGAILLALTLPVSAGLFDHWNDGELTVEFVGRGLESGQVLELKIANSGSSAKTFQLPQLTVLEPSDPTFAPVLIESKGAWKMGPGNHFTLRVGGYSLDHSKKMPRSGQAIVYRPTAGGTRYQKAQHALRKSLQVEEKSGFKAAILPPKKHRALVIQRVIWRSFGGNNPKTPQALVEDLAEAFERRGKVPSERAVEALAGSIWQDVDLVCRALAGS